MKKLLLKAWRDILSAKGQYIAITIVMALGVAFYCGVLSASSGVEKNIGAFYEDQRLADWWIYTAGADKAAVEQIRALSGAAYADGRALAYGAVGGVEFVVHALPDAPTVNLPFMEEGALPAAANDCIIDRGYAEANGVRLGDTLNVALGTETYALTVRGVFNSPEYLLLMKSVTDITPDRTKFGALFVSESLLPGAPYNEIIIKAAPGADLDALKRQAEAILAPYGLGAALGRDKLLSWTMLDDDIRQFSQVGAIFPNIFFFVAALIIFISMSKNVETQRQQIGNMKALGVRGGWITFHFLSYTLITAAIGSLAGALLGVFVITPFIQSIFTTIYTMPALRVTGVAGSIAVASALCFAFGTLATVVSVRKPLKESAASAMRPKAPRKAKPIFLERSGRLWAKIPFGRKIMWRNLLMNKTRVALSAVGITGCVGLLLAAFGFMDSVNSMLYDKFDDMYRCDVLVSLKTPVTEDAFPIAADGVTAAWGQSTMAAAIGSGDKTVTADFTAVAENCAAIALYDEKGHLLAFPRDGVLMPQKFARKFGLSVGDAVTLSVTGSDGAARDIRVTVAGVALEYLGQTIYTSLDYLRALGETPQIAQFYVSLTTDANHDAVADALGKDPRVKVAMTKADIAAKTEQSMSIMKSLVYILIAASGILALTVVYNISAINIFERRRDIATLKVLGFRRAEVNRLVFTENLIITGVGAIFGIAAGFGLLWLIIQTALTDAIMAPMVVLPLSLLYAPVLGFAFTVLANQLLRGKIRGIDMVESLKSAE